MTEEIEYDWATGFAIIMGIILLAVIIYTIISLRKQVAKRKAEEAKKQSHVGDRKDTNRENTKDGN